MKNEVVAASPLMGFSWKERQHSYFLEFLLKSYSKAKSQKNYWCIASLGFWRPWEKMNKLASIGTTQEDFQGILENYQVLKRKMATLT